MTSATERLAQRQLDALERAEAETARKAAADQAEADRAAASRAANEARDAERAQAAAEAQAAENERLRAAAEAANLERRLASLRRGITTNAAHIEAAKAALATPGLPPAKRGAIEGQLAALEEKAAAMAAQLEELEAET